MANETVEYGPALADITQVTRQILGTAPRKIDIFSSTDADGEPQTKVEVDIEAKETHDYHRLTQLRSMLHIVFGRHRELGSVHLTFRANMSGTFGSRKRGPDVSHIRQMIEKLPS
jgi:hypothetical protein